MKIRKIYLAGGFKSEWQKIVKEACPKFTYFDPSLHKILDPAEYTECDLGGVRECDIIFAYMEKSNPAGYALALEIGYGKALGKQTIFVENELENPRKRYFDMVRHVCDQNFQSLNEAIIYLQKI